MAKQNCPTCKGTGSIEEKHPLSDSSTITYTDHILVIKTCPDCGGWGTYHLCKDCDPVRNPMCDLCIGA